MHPDPRVYLYIAEVVAGLVEEGDGAGETGLRRRAAIEAEEEAGLQLGDEAFDPIGGALFGLAVMVRFLRMRWFDRSGGKRAAGDTASVAQRPVREKRKCGFGPFPCPESRDGEAGAPAPVYPARP